ncbi:unnamed protein product [Prunus armeniaca]
MQDLLAVLNETTRLYLALPLKNFSQRDGLMKMVFSNSKALSNSQPSMRVQGFVWGNDFAYREALIFSDVLWGRYVFKLSDDNKVARYKTMPTLHFKRGLYVQASPRLGHTKS